MTKVLYLHGFASGPQSKKAVYFQSQLNNIGIDCVVPDLNQPDFFGMTMSNQIATALDFAKNLKTDNLVLIGSSMGGLLATILAEQYLDVSKLILLAPGFGITGRWPLFLGQPDALDLWRQKGSWPFMHYALGRQADLSYQFVEDLQNYPMAVCAPDAIRLKKPAVIFHGLHDLTVPFDNSAAVQANNKDIELVQLDDNHELVSSLPLIWQSCKQRL